MTSVEPDKGDRASLHISRRQRAPWRLVIVGTAALVGSIAITYWNLTYPGGPFDPVWAFMSSFAAVLAVIGIALGIHDTRPLTVIIGPDGISCVGRETTEIAWGPDVRVDVRRDDAYGDRRYGPLAGWSVSDGSGATITIDAGDGWDIEDVRRLWGPVADIVETRQLNVGDEMRWYMRYREDVGLNG